MVTSENGVMWIGRPQEKTVLTDWQPTRAPVPGPHCHEKISEWYEVPELSLVNILLVCITTFVYNDQICIVIKQSMEMFELHSKSDWYDVRLKSNQQKGCVLWRFLVLRNLSGALIPNLLGSVRRNLQTSTVGSKQK